MFCKYCGTEIKGNDKVCPVCGKSEENFVKSILQSKRILALAVGTLLILFLLILLPGKTIKVDMKQLYDVRVDGLEGMGTATVAMNQEKWDEIYDAISEEYDEANDKADRILERLYSLDIKISKQENLSNGERIIVTVDFPEKYFDEYKIKGKNLEWEIEVEGLTIPTEIDVFEGLEIEFEGISPFITCNIITAGCNDFAKKHVEFGIPQYFYEDGESVEVQAVYSEKSLLEEQVKVLKDTAEYEAKSAEYYVTDLFETDVDISSLKEAIHNRLQFEYSIADDLFCDIELGWTNHYAGLKEETEKREAYLVLKEKDLFNEEWPYNMYITHYRTKIDVEHRSRGYEGVFETEIDILLIATNLYVDESGTLRFDDTISLLATEVEGISDWLNVYIDNYSHLYQAIVK